MSVRTAETDDKQICVVGTALYLNVGHRNLSDLLGTQVTHQVMVLRVGGDDTRITVFFQTTQDVRVAFLTGDSPIADTGFGIAAVGCIVVFHVGGRSKAG